MKPVAPNEPLDAAMTTEGFRGSINALFNAICDDNSGMWSNDLQFALDAVVAAHSAETEPLIEEVKRLRALMESAKKCLSGRASYHHITDDYRMSAGAAAELWHCLSTEPPAVSPTETAND